MSAVSFGRTYLRSLFIRWGWKRCDHRNANSDSWRDRDGTLMVRTDCPDCGWHDFGHVHEAG